VQKNWDSIVEFVRRIWPKVQEIVEDVVGAIIVAFKAVTVVASDETVVLTLHEALTPAEKILARTETGAAKVEQYHRALFAVSCDELRREIERLTGRKVREAAVVVEPATGAIVHAFTSGTVVQIFQLEPHGVSTHVSAGIPADEGKAPG
jgi:uncharacterized protein YbcI